MKKDGKKFIPVDKMSKKDRKAYYAKQRNTWGDLNPVTRSFPNSRGYERNKWKQEDRKSGSFTRYDENSCRFFFCLCKLSDNLVNCA